MTLKACRECGKEVSGRAKTCPHCGVSNPAIAPTAQFLAGIVIVILLGVSVTFCMSANGRKDAVAPPSTRPTGQDAAIDPSVFAPYTRKMYPKDFAKWGRAGFARIDALRAAAAHMAAAHRVCDRVGYSELSDRANAKTGYLEVFTDCDNGWRYRIAEHGGKENGPKLLSSQCMPTAPCDRR